MLDFSWEANLAPKLDRLQRELELDTPELRRVLTTAPTAMGLSLEGTLLPRLAALAEVFALSKEELRRLVLKLPLVLLMSVEPVPVTNSSLTWSKAGEHGCQSTVLIPKQCVLVLYSLPCWSWDTDVRQKCARYSLLAVALPFWCRNGVCRTFCSCLLQLSMKWVPGPG